MTNRFSDALALRPQTVPPVWMMRQAGRYQRAYGGPFAFGVSIHFDDPQAAQWRLHSNTRKEAPDQRSADLSLVSRRRHAGSRLPTRGDRPVGGPWTLSCTVEAFGHTGARCASMPSVGFASMMRRCSSI
jgi:hypothetical protein